MDPLEKGNGPQSMSLYCGPREQSPFHPASEMLAGAGDRPRRISSLFLNLRPSLRLYASASSFSPSHLFLSRHPSIFLHLLVLAVGSGEASEALVGLCSHRKKTSRDLKNREALVIALGSLQPRVQGRPQPGRPTWKHPLGFQTHQLLEASVHRPGGLDGIEKPFPLCVTCANFRDSPQ